MTSFLQHFAELFAQSAPWLLLGLLIAGMMQWLLPTDLLQRQLGGNSIWSVVKAAFIGAPLPLCSCGVIPAAVGLHRGGASKPATVAFLVSTPETGVDSISVSYALLGPFIAIFRPIAAIVTALYAGLMVLFFAKESTPARQLQQSKTASGGCGSSKATQHKSECCSSQNEAAEVQPETKESSPGQSCCASKATPAPEASSCCSGKAGKQTSAASSLLTRLGGSLQFASGKLLRDISVWLLIGLLLAAAIETWVPTDFLTQWGDGWLAMVVMAVVGIPMYICATASTPMALGFLSAGVSPGAIVVFMLAGPATNISTMGMIRQELGGRVLGLYLFCVFSSSIALGYSVNWLIDQFGWSVGSNVTQIHQHGLSLWYWFCALVLATLMLRNLWLWWQQKSADQQQTADVQ